MLDCVGHAGGYSARGYAALGRRTAVVGHVGDDPLGRWVRAELQHDGIDVGALGTDPAGTARSVNHLAADGSRRNFYDGRGHLTLDAPPYDWTGVRLAHVHLAHWTRTLLPALRSNGVTIAVDLQDVRDPADPYRADHVRHADVLFFSAADADPEELFAAWPAPVMVAGLGARGAAVHVGGRTTVHPPVDMPEPVVDTDGAGDALAVGFLTAFVLEGRPVDEAIRDGLVAARWACAQLARSDTLIRADRLRSGA